MYVDAKDRLISYMIVSTGTWQHDFISLIGHIVKSGNFVLNLGAQSGLEAIIMGKIVGPTGKIFVFQPYSFSNSLAIKNMELNGLKDIATIYKMGASDTKATGIINVSYMHTGGSEIVSGADKDIGDSKYDETQEVQLNRVDELLPEDVILNFALLDVEKMETKALNGMRKIIERSPNLVIMT